tara:strand:+ start:598 stop:1158 length:561 start_codon:yes stop_codon:yes gene_type:complete
MAYKCVYELKCTEYNSENDDNIEKEVRRYTERVDATDFNMEELLLVFEDFLRASGYDWIEPNSLNIEGYELPTKELDDKDFERMRLMLERLNEKKESVLKSNPIELAERMMGIDRTAKIHHKDGKVVTFPNNSKILSEKSVEPEIDMTVQFDYDENIFSEDNDFSQYQYTINFDLIGENQEETKNE